MLKREYIVCIANHLKADISHQHRQKIQRIFQEAIAGELCIDHFSINVFFGHHESLFFSPTPQMAEELCKKNFVSMDSNYKHSIYTAYTMYPWRSVEKNEIDAAINHIKEEKYGLRHGTMIVRDLGENRYVMYSFATRKKEPIPGLFRFLFYCKADYIARMGDYMYNELHNEINEYTAQENIHMPKIASFKRIDLQHAFNDEFQQTLCQSIHNNKLNHFLQAAEKRSASMLRLVDGGRVKW